MLTLSFFACNPIALLDFSNELVALALDYLPVIVRVGRIVWTSPRHAALALAIALACGLSHLG
jgi:hypothetical protein